MFTDLESLAKTIRDLEFEVEEKKKSSGKENGGGGSFRVFVGLAGSSEREPHPQSWVC